MSSKKFKKIQLKRTACVFVEKLPLSKKIKKKLPGILILSLILKGRAYRQKIFPNF
jgi:hypothetical protein